MNFLIFFSIVLVIYVLVNYYIFVRGLRVFPSGSAWRPYYVWGFWLLASTYVAGRVVEKFWLGPVSDVLVWTGSFWLGAMLYFFLLVVVFDLLRLSHHLIGWYPGAWVAAWDRVQRTLMAGSLVLVALLLTLGHINTRFPKIRHLEIHIPKETGSMDSLRVALVSDIHLGTLIGSRQLGRLTDMVNGLQPDIILLAGDILDEDLEPVIRQNTGQTLKRLHAPLGVFGVMGNHEYIGGPERAYDYLEDHGITILRDSAIKVNQSFYLLGREDRDKNRFTGRKRLPLSKLMEGINLSYPVILVDHQPFYLEEAAQLGVDLQLSGHTHHGQLWPLNLITRAMFRISHGYGNVQGMHAYVSNGAGTWGPPVRIGNRPEIVNLKLHFVKADR